MVLNLYLLCDGWASPQAEVARSTSAIPHYKNSGGASLTSFTIEPPVPVEPGDVVELIFRTTSGNAVTGVHMKNVDPLSHFVFHHAPHGLEHTTDWDMVVQVHVD